MSINGRVTLKRRWWHSESVGSEAPLDAILHADGSKITPGVREMCCRLSIGLTAFEQTAADLLRTAQVGLSRETVRQVVVAEGGCVQHAQSSGQLPTSFTAADCGVDKETASVETASKEPASRETDRTRPEAAASSVISTESAAPNALAASAPPAELSPEGTRPIEPASTIKRMYLGVDGVMVPTITDPEKAKRRERVLKRRERRALKDPQKVAELPLLAPRRVGTDCTYKEFKVIEFRNESLDHQHIILSAARRPEVGEIVKHTADRLGFQGCDEKVAIVDGANWIPEQIESSGVEVDGLGLDFYHLSEHVHAACRAVFGERTSAGDRWVSEQLHRFKHDGYDGVVPDLMTWRASLRGRKRKAATKLLNYVTDRRAMIQYPEFQAEGWQIGSGPTESRCRTSTRRLKLGGARWDIPNAEAVAALANLSDSRQWNLYWPHLKPVNQVT